MKDTETAPMLPAAAPPTRLSLDEVRQCTRLLEAVVENRFLLASISEADRNALLSAAGRMVHPDRDTKARLAKALRRDRKETKRDHDRTVRSTTEIRTMRRAAVFTAPQLPPPPSEQEGPERILEVPRHCYVCKAEFRKLHFFYDAL